MNATPNKTLQNELAAAGASKAERASLASIAAQLKALKPTEESQASKWRLFFVVGAPAALGLVVGVLVVIFSQTVLPGSPLYPVQKASDSVATSLDPSYRGIVMMKRADQVKALVNGHASSGKVLATLADYQKQAANYKSQKTNYAAFEYCKQSLEQAATAAPNPERQAINSTMQSLNNV